MRFLRTRLVNLNNTEIVLNPDHIVTIAPTEKAGQTRITLDDREGSLVIAMDFEQLVNWISVVSDRQ